MIQVRAIPAFADNYIWCIDDGRRAFVVDPGDAAPVLERLDEWQLQLAGILVTHHHFDHVGGIEALLESESLPVYGPASSSPCIDHPLVDGDLCQVLGVDFEVLAVPGHTLDHIAYFNAGAADQPLLFCGDTLFAGGCGRVFEGTPEQMYASLQRLAALPADTQVFCAHEYTEANLRFAVAVEPENADLQARQRDAAALRAQDRATVPSTIELELLTNPFLRCQYESLQDAAKSYGNMPQLSAVATFAAVRRWKDNF